MLSVLTTYFEAVIVPNLVANALFAQEITRSVLKHIWRQSLSLPNTDNRARGAWIRILLYLKNKAIQ